MPIYFPPSIAYKVKTIMQLFSKKSSRLFWAGKMALSLTVNLCAVKHARWQSLSGTDIICVCVTGRVMMRLRRRGGRWPVCSTWWSQASCSSTSPASGWTSSKLSLSQDPFPTMTSCVPTEVTTLLIKPFSTFLIVK